jgi:tetratricopeptide (TPR) repeat protein
VLVVAAGVALAGFVTVFVYLPAWVEQAEPPPEPVVTESVEAEPAGPVLSEQERAELRDRAESLLAELLEQQQDLAERAAASWGDTTWSAYENAARLADEAFLAENLTQAVAAYETALSLGAELLARSESIVADALIAGDQAIVSGNGELASSQYELVLAIDPDNTAAQHGLARAATLPNVIDAMRRGAAHEEAGEYEQAAAAYREVLGIDPDFVAARTALASINRRVADTRFERLITEGYAAIDDRQFALAAEQFTAALAVRPDSETARDGLEQAEQGLELDAIAMAEIRGMAFERRERWDQAIERYREALSTDPTLAFAIEGLERSQRRADLDAKLKALLDQPRLLLTEAVLQDAQRVLGEARAIAEPGPTLSAQIDQLDQLIALASKPISITLISDNATEVTLYRVGELGSFASKTVDLKPGSYTAVGQRRGYRDVRQNFTVLPGADNGPVSIVCMEPI